MLMRPGTRIKFWNPRFSHRPDIGPPLLLRLVSGLCILSVVATILYATAEALNTVSFTYIDAPAALYIALQHFVLPLLIAYTLSSNSPLSRPLIFVYWLAYPCHLVVRDGWGAVVEALSPGVIVATFFVGAFLVWLFAAPKPRAFYLLISGKPLLERLKPQERLLSESSWLPPRLRLGIEWFLDRLEFVVLVALIIVGIAAAISIDQGFGIP